jgi:hypothetical protein
LFFRHKRQREAVAVGFGLCVALPFLTWSRLVRWCACWRAVVGLLFAMGRALARPFRFVVDLLLLNYANRPAVRVAGALPGGFLPGT